MSSLLRDIFRAVDSHVEHTASSNFGAQRALRLQGWPSCPGCDDLETNTAHTYAALSATNEAIRYANPRGAVSAGL